MVESAVLTFPALPLPQVCQLGFQEFDHAWTLPPIVLANHALILVTRGRMGFTVGQEQSQLAQGDLLLIPAGTCLFSDPSPHAPFACAWVHWAQTDRDKRVSIAQALLQTEEGVALPGHAATTSLFVDARARADRNVIFPRMALCDCFAEVRHTWWRAAQEVETPRYGGEVAVAVRFAEVLMLITREALKQAGGEKAPRTELPWLVQRAMTAMRERYSTTLSIAALAAELRVTPQHLIRLFRRTLGVSPRAMLERIRIERATALLKGSTLNIKEICYAVGFQDQRYFSRTFRRVSGGTPSELRGKSPVIQ